MSLMERNLERTGNDIKFRVQLLSFKPCRCDKCGVKSMASNKDPKPKITKVVTPVFKIDPATFPAECLKAHNDYRAMHDAGPLTMSEKLCLLANEWAKLLAEKGTLEHRPNCKYGENLFYSMGKPVKGESPVDNWYSEIKFYDFSIEKFQPKAGHFTQAIWKGTTEMGVGYAYKDKATFVVCYYNPPGNVIGQFQTNVVPKSK